MNTVKFLKNYRIFASEARYQASLVYLEEMKRVNQPNNQKLMMLKIVYELIASTEDLSMWLIAIGNRNNGDKRYRDIWERLLNTFIKEDNHSEANKVLKSFKRIKTTSGLLKKLDMPTITSFAKENGMTKEQVEEGLKALKTAIDSSIYNREVSDGVMVRTYNKIKHGMMVYLDPKDINKIWFRDFWSGYKGKHKKRLTRKNREMELGLNIQKAEKIVGTTKSISQAIQALVGMVLFDLEYRIKTGKFLMRKKNKEFWINELNNGDI